ncbi:hypothetical protein ACWF5H_16300, partial [Arthrobacter sp. NPDC055138]
MAADPLDEAQEPEEHSGSKAMPDGVSKAVHGAEQESENDSEPETELAAEPVPNPDGTAPAQSAADPATAEDGLPSELAARGTGPGAVDSPVASGPEGDTPEGMPAGRELWEEDWRELEPAELAGLLAGTDPEALDDWSVLEYLKAVRKHEAWTQSRRTHGLHRMAVLRPAT